MNKPLPIEQLARQAKRRDRRENTTKWRAVLLDGLKPEYVNAAVAEYERFQPRK